VHSIVSLSAPFKGIPRLMRATVSGDNFGMNNLCEHDTIKFFQNMGGIPLHLPYGLKYTYGNVFKVGSEARTVEQMMSTNNLKKLYEDFYKEKSAYCNPEENGDILNCPPVKNLLAIYGINIPTESAYVFNNDLKLNLNFQITPEEEYDGCNSKNGIIFETKKTLQYSGTKSGDGIVPYASLSVPLPWMNLIDKVKTVEFQNLDHNNILSNDSVFEVIVHHLCESSHL